MLCKWLFVEVGDFLGKSAFFFISIESLLTWGSVDSLGRTSRAVIHKTSFNHLQIRYHDPNEAYDGSAWIDQWADIVTGAWRCSPLWVAEWWIRRLEIPPRVISNSSCRFPRLAPRLLNLMKLSSAPQNQDFTFHHVILIWRNVNWGVSAPSSRTQFTDSPFTDQVMLWLCHLWLKE